jgi:hypothetical protein
MTPTLDPCSFPLLGPACLLLLALSPCSGAVSGAGHGPPEGPLFRDCNANGIEDAIDIALGTSCDADFDGVPDECQRRRP